MMKLLWLILGIISLGLGILGIFLPILPTTPFLLLASALFLKSSKRLYIWLLEHKILGNYVYYYIRFRAIKLSTKIFSISLVWVTITISFILVPIFLVRIVLIVIALGVSFHLLRLKTLTNQDIKDGTKEKAQWIAKQIEKNE